MGLRGVAAKLAGPPVGPPLGARMVPYYDGVNDISNYRLDVLYGVRLLDGRLATRLSGTA